MGSLLTTSHGAESLEIFLFQSAVSLVADAAGVLALILCGYAAILCLPDLFLIAVHLLKDLRPGAHPEAPSPRHDGASPTPLVSVQLPLHNEPDLVGPAIDSLCGMSWPREKLEILVLDDSTDHTTRIAADRVRHWQASGVNVELVHRPHRMGFKAGALAVALERTRAELIAIFDVDYRPAADFVEAVVPVLQAEPRAAFVQARLDHRNRDHNLLTRAQAIELDMYLVYEQAGRAAAGIPTPFNGTCALWRREAIVDAGGWRSRTLVEDLDLSLRAFAQGWRSINLVGVAVAGELPETIGVLVRQRTRWATGTGQAFRALPWRLLKQLNWRQAVVFGLLVQFHTYFMAALSVAIASTCVAWVLGSSIAASAAIALAATIGTVVILKSIGAALAARTIGRLHWKRFGADLVAMWLTEAVLLPVVGKALVEGLMGRIKPFTRTPKRGA